MPDSVSHPTTAALLAHRSAFKSFLVARVGNEADAEDLLQNGLVKALQHAHELKDGAKLTGWFYQVLRNAVVDHHRSRTSARRRDDAWAAQADTLDLARDPDAHREICRCFEPLLRTLKPTHADLLRRVELHDESVSVAAHALGITANNASVTLHRARAELRKKLEAFCGACAADACLDCHCTDTNPASPV